MTIYARSDLASVSVSSAHGGCQLGRHTRPVENGAPAKEWRLDCPQCEDFLRFDPCWNPIQDKVPETPDESSAREERQKRTDTDTQRLMAQAVTSLPEILSQMVAGNTELVKQFIQLAASKGTLPAELSTNSVKGEVISRAREIDPADSLSSLSINELRYIAKSRGVAIPNDKRDKSSLVDLLKVA